MIKVIVRDFTTEKDQKIWFNTPYHLRSFIRDICGLSEIPETVADALEVLERILRDYCNH